MYGVCVYISIFMYDMLKFPISVHGIVIVVVVCAFGCLTMRSPTLSIHLEFELGAWFCLLNAAPFYFICFFTAAAAAGFKHKMLISTHVLFCVSARVFVLDLARFLIVKNC